MPALHLRTDQTLHEQLTAIARADGRSLNAYLLGLIRADVSRRQRLANAVGLSWRATDAELADALGEAVSAPLSDIEQSHLPRDPSAAVAYAAGRAAKRASKPSPATKPAPSTKPAPAPATKPQTRSKAPGKVVLAASEYRALLARRAKRLGQAVQTYAGPELVTVAGNDPDLLPHHRAVST